VPAFVTLHVANTLQLFDQQSDAVHMQKASYFIHHRHYWLHTPFPWEDLMTQLTLSST